MSRPLVGVQHHLMACACASRHETFPFGCTRPLGGDDAIVCRCQATVGQTISLYLLLHTLGWAQPPAACCHMVCQARRHATGHAHGLTGACMARQPASLIITLGSAHLLGAGTRPPARPTAAAAAARPVPRSHPSPFPWLALRSAQSAAQAGAPGAGALRQPAAASCPASACAAAVRRRTWAGTAAAACRRGSHTSDPAHARTCSLKLGWGQVQYSDVTFCFESACSKVRKMRA